jgi:hypothetical protein
MTSRGVRLDRRVAGHHSGGIHVTTPWSLLDRRPIPGTTLGVLPSWG